MTERIVVGVDGSETAKLATRWAAREARLRGATLELVTAWEVAPVAYGYGYVAIPEEFLEGLVKGAEDTMAAAVEVVRAEAPDAEVQTKVVEGPAARVLLEEAEGADLLVVGCRGLGGFRELVLGSVSQQCAHHAPCPVLIVRHVHEQG
jgi:nucleotide-binding universal stress UspA family protein